VLGRASFKSVGKMGDVNRLLAEAATGGESSGASMVMRISPELPLRCGQNNEL
jgi:hypothetical protein